MLFSLKNLIWIGNTLLKLVLMQFYSFIECNITVYVFMQNTSTCSFKISQSTDNLQKLKVLQFYHPQINTV